jgi:hypothetical protein
VAKKKRVQAVIEETSEVVQSDVVTEIQKARKKAVAKVAKAVIGASPAPLAEFAAPETAGETKQAHPKKLRKLYSKLAKTQKKLEKLKNKIEKKSQASVQ